MISRITIGLLILFCLAPQSASAGDRLWEHDAKAAIVDYHVSPLGNVIILSTSGLSALDPETGQTQWQREYSAMDPELTMFTMLPCAILHTHKMLTAVDVETGDVWWDRSAIPLKKIYGYLPMPGFGAILVFGKSDNSDKSVVLIDFATGETRWQQDGLLEKKPKTEQYSASAEFYGTRGTLQTMTRHQRPIVHDGGIVFYVSKDGLMKVDAETGRLLWKVRDLKGKSAPMRGKGYAPFVVQDDVVFVPYDRKLIAVNMNNGSVVWHRDKKFKSYIRQMEMSVEGLVVLGYKGPDVHIDPNWGTPDKDKAPDPARDFCMEVLVPESGMSSWDKPLTELDAPLPFFVDEDYAFVPRTEDVILVDLQQGSYSQFARIEMKGKNEYPTHVERVGDSYLVASTQNMILLKSRGGKRYHAYYPAPGLDWVQKIVAVTAGFILDEVFDTELEEPRFSSDGVITRTWQARAFGTAAFELCGERFKATIEGQKYRYIYTDKPDGGRKGYSLVKVEKATGKEVKRIWVDKQIPTYKIDLATDTVYVIEGFLHNKIFAVR